MKTIPFPVNQAGRSTEPTLSELMRSEAEAEKQMLYDWFNRPENRTYKYALLERILIDKKLDSATH